MLLQNIQRYFSLELLHIHIYENNEPVNVLINYFLFMLSKQKHCKKSHLVFNDYFYFLIGDKNNEDKIKFQIHIR